MRRIRDPFGRSGPLNPPKPPQSIPIKVLQELISNMEATHDRLNKLRSFEWNGGFLYALSMAHNFHNHKSKELPKAIERYYNEQLEGFKRDWDEYEKEREEVK